MPLPEFENARRGAKAIALDEAMRAKVAQACATDGYEPRTTPALTRRE